MDDEIFYGNQALQFLKSSRISRIDPSKHLNILLNPEILSAEEVGQNAKLILRFIK